MSLSEKAKILSKLAELKRAKGPDDIIDWFNNNGDWIYVMINQVFTVISNNYGIMSCNKTMEDDIVTFTMDVNDSDVIYNGIKKIISDNSSMVNKMSAKFSVNKVGDKMIVVNVYTIPGRTESFMKLINTIEDGISNLSN